jgi:hypothetical protein
MQPDETADGPTLPPSPTVGESLPTRPLASTPTGVESANLAIKGYEIEGILGKGGMGVVYKAKQVGLNRTIALVAIALRLRRLAREAAGEPAGRPPGSSLFDSDKNAPAPLLETPLPGR